MTPHEGKARMTNRSTDAITGGLLLAAILALVWAGWPPEAYAEALAPPKLVYAAQNVSYTSGADLLSSDYDPHGSLNKHDAVRLRISITLSGTAAKLTKHCDDGTTAEPSDYQVGGDLAVDSGYVFEDVLATRLSDGSNLAYNFTLDDNTTIDLIQIFEVPLQ